MLARRVVAAVVVVAMAAFGFGVYHYLGGLRSHATAQKAKAPSKTVPRFTLPGTIYVAQSGAIYRFQNGVFTQVAIGGWTMPAAAPGGQLVAVKRSGVYSDLYLLDAGGQPVSQLTHNARKDVTANHWSFYPRLTADGRTLFYSWDPKDPFGNLYRVDLAVLSMPFPAGQQGRATVWTRPNHYTGGDVQPVPLASGGVLYTKYGISADSQNISQIWVAPRPGAIGHAITAENDNCGAPALTADGTKLAMVCTAGTQVARLEIAPFDGNQLGPPTVIAQGLVAAPAWSPDGLGLLFYEAVGPTGHFQLFYVNLAPPPTPKPSPSATAGAVGSPAASPAPAPTPTPPPPPVPKQVTTENDFDTTSAPVWT